MSPRINSLAKYIYDVYNQSLNIMRQKAPSLIAPLKKALRLCMDDHVIIHPPDPTRNSTNVWIASVYSQNARHYHQYLVHYDRKQQRYICNCPSFATGMYKLEDGRTFCKHMIATQIMMKAHRAHGKHHNNNTIAKYVQAQDLLMDRPLPECATKEVDEDVHIQ